jgi:mono/diheme cytochrome c family protein
MKRHFRTPVLLAVAAALWAVPCAGQAGGSSDTASVLDGVYTSEQAGQGRQVFDAECALCHSPGEFTGVVFQVSWAGRPLGALFTHLRMTMPMDAPGSLTPAQYASVMSYMLQLNGYPTGEKALPASPDSLNMIRMERIPDDGRGRR